MTGLVADGLALGVVYGVVGVAVLLVAMATRTILLAVGPVLVAGVLVQATLSAADVHVALAAAAGVALAAAAGAVLEPLVLRPQRDPLARVLGIAVAGVVVEAAVARGFGAGSVRPDPVVMLPDLGPLPGAVVLALLVGTALAAVLTLVTLRSRLGIRARLVGGAPEAAIRAGVEPTRVRTTVLALAGASAAAGGILVAPIAFAGVSQSAGFTVRGVAAAVLAGRGGPVGAVAAGLALGLVEAAAQTAAPALGADVAVGLVVVAALVIRGGEGQQAWGRAW